MRQSRLHGDRNLANKRILIISDTHAPYHHKDAIRFLTAIKEKYDPDRVIHIGDEADKHALSYHDSDPDLDSAGRELEQAKEFLWKIEELYPRMTVIESNHGSLALRKAKTAGIPRAYLRPYKEIYETPKWNWVPHLTLTLPNGQPCHFVHGLSANTRTLTLSKGMSAVQGHYHEKFEIVYWGNEERLNFGMTVSCLIDDDAMAFNYNKVFVKRPIIGCGMIIDSQPKQIPLVKKTNGRWNGRVN